MAIVGSRARLISRALPALICGAALLTGMHGCVESTIAAAGATAGFGLAQGQAESFIRGELKSARMVSLALSRLAVAAALQELELEIREERQGEFDGYLRGKAEGGREIKVYLKADSPAMTRFSIRVGMMGDIAVSRLVMSRIDVALGQETAATMPHPIDDADPDDR